jgi:TrpR-related protein YerC/YecD
MKRNLEKQLNNKEAQELYQALAKLKKPEEIAYFLRDLLTMEEIEEAIRRFQVAKMLSEGRTFRQISAKTKMSSTTIARINYWLNHGTEGYRLALSKLKA